MQSDKFGGGVLGFERPNILFIVAARYGTKDSLKSQEKTK